MEQCKLSKTAIVLNFPSSGGKRELIKGNSYCHLSLHMEAQHSLSLEGTGISLTETLKDITSAPNKKAGRATGGNGGQGAFLKGSKTIHCMKYKNNNTRSDVKNKMFIY